MAVVVLYGSELGTAELAADSVTEVLAKVSDVSVYSMADFDIADLDPETFCVLVCSTYGTGEFPTEAEPFFDALDLHRPNLAGLRFAVFGLGDSVYETTYNRAGELAAESSAHSAPSSTENMGAMMGQPRSRRRTWPVTGHGV